MSLGERGTAPRLETAEDCQVIRLAELTSRLQRISLMRHPEMGLMLILDGAVQFLEATEYRYHECLGVVPMLFGRPRTAFIGGGGDGLLAARLLRFPEIERIVLCDYDAAVTDLCRTQPDLVALSSASLSDPRVEIVNEDAVGYLERTDDTFGLIVCDFPHPLTDELSRLYSQSTFALISERLAKGGVACVQTAMVPRARALIVNTMRSVFQHARFYRTHFQGEGWNGFTLAANEPLERTRSVPDWTRYLTEEVVDTLFVIPPDERVESDEINTVENGRLARVTLLDLYLDIASTPCSHDPQYRVVAIDRDNRCVPDLLPTFLRYCDEIQPLIVYLDRELRSGYERLLERLGYRLRRSYRRMGYRFTSSNLRRIDELWARIDNGIVSHIEAHECSSHQHPEIVRLMEEYLLRFGDRYLDVPAGARVLQRTRHHLLVRDRRGRPALLMVLLFGDVVTVDIVFGRGSARANLLGILLCLRFIARKHGSRIRFDAATENIESFMGKIGADPEGWYDVFVRDVRPGRGERS